MEVFFWINFCVNFEFYGLFKNEEFWVCKVVCFVVVVIWILVLKDKYNFINFLFLIKMVLCKGVFLYLFCVCRLLLVCINNLVVVMFFIISSGLFVVFMIVLCCKRIFIIFLWFFIEVMYKVVWLLLFFKLMLYLFVSIFCIWVLFLVWVVLWRLDEFCRFLLLSVCICFINWVNLVNGLYVLDVLLLFIMLDNYVIIKLLRLFLICFIFNIKVWDIGYICILII